MVSRSHLILLTLVLITVGVCIVGVLWIVDRHTVVTNLGEPPIRAKEISPDIINATRVKLCDVLRSPEAFKDRFIRIHGIFYVTREVSGIYEPDCKDSKKTVSFEFQSQSEEELTEANELLNRIQSFRDFEFPARAEVLVVGKIDCSDNRGYGHLNSSSCEFKASRLEEARPISKDLPWHW